MYKNILTGYINQSKKNPEQRYLTIKNVSEEQIVIEPGTSLFLNMTPGHIREKNPNIPVFSKSIKIEDEPPVQKHSEELFTGEVNDSIPF